jgi:hypothetical protein
VHFTIPYFCKYITRRIEEDLIWNTDRSSDQERLEMFLSNVDKYEFQMKRRQTLSSRKWLYFFISNWRIIRLLAYLLVVLLNFMLLFSIVHEYSVTKESEGHNVYTILEVYNNFSTLIKKEFQIGVTILEIAQLIFCLINFVLVLYDSAPEILFEKYLSEKSRRNQKDRTDQANRQLKVFNRVKFVQSEPD